MPKYCEKPVCEICGKPKGGYNPPHTDCAKIKQNKRAQSKDKKYAKYTNKQIDNFLKRYHD